MTLTPERITSETVKEIAERRQKRTFSAGEHNEICERLPPNFMKRVSEELDRYESDIATLLTAYAELEQKLEIKERVVRAAEQANLILQEELREEAATPAPALTLEDWINCLHTGPLAAKIDIPEDDARTIAEAIIDRLTSATPQTPPASFTERNIAGWLMANMHHTGDLTLGDGLRLARDFMTAFTPPTAAVTEAELSLVIHKELNRMGFVFGEPGEYSESIARAILSLIRSKGAA